MEKLKNKADSQESIFMRNIQRGIDKGIVTLSADYAKITYHCTRDFTTNFKDPEEKIRGSYFDSKGHRQIVSFSSGQRFEIEIEKIASSPGTMPPIYSSGWDSRYNLEGFITYSGSSTNFIFDIA